MTRFVVDSGVVIRLASQGLEAAAEHELFAPTLLRSQTLSALHEAVHRGEIPEEATRLARQVKGVVPMATIDALGAA